jgi:hypothetical protein
MRATLQWARSAKEGSDQVRTQVRKGVTYGAGTAAGTGIVYLIWRVFEMVSKSKGGV